MITKVALKALYFLYDAFFFSITTLEGPYKMIQDACITDINSYTVSITTQQRTTLRDETIARTISSTSLKYQSETKTELYTYIGMKYRTLHIRYRIGFTFTFLLSYMILFISIALVAFSLSKAIEAIEDLSNNNF